MPLKLLADLALTALLLYLFLAGSKQALRRRRDPRAAGLVVVLLLVPSLAMIHWYGGWDFSAASPLNDPERWWNIVVSNEKGGGGKIFNLVTTGFLFATFYLSGTIIVDGLAFWYNRQHGGHVQALHRGLIIWLAVAAGILLYLKHQGISLTPILFGMGAASLVMGLALQEPLSNLFAGLALDMEGAIRVGDWVRVDVDGGTVGKVVDKGWRTTRLLTLEEDLITLPNRVVGAQKISNYCQPTLLHAHRIFISASYSDPPVKVKEVLRTILLREPRIAKDPPPVVRTVDYQDYAVSYELRFFLYDFAENTIIKDEILTRIWYAFKYNGIEMPFPIRTLHVKEHTQLVSEETERDANLQDLFDFFKSLPFLQTHLLLQDFDFLARNAFQRTYTPGESVIIKGIMGDALFIVRQGWCEILLPTGECKRLEAGTYFGEMALLKAGPRNTGVIAGEQGALVVRVDRECMNKLFGYYPELREQFEHTQHARVLESGFALAEVEQEEAFRDTLKRLLKDLLTPW